MEHEEALSVFRGELEARGLRFTIQRKAIIEVFFDTGGHLSLNRILELVKARQPSVGFATVYRSMKLLVECGLAEEHHFDQGQKYYEPALGADHHDHLICLSCGLIQEFEAPVVEAAQAEIAARFEFVVLDHRHEIFGRCKECQAKENLVITE